MDLFSRLQMTIQYTPAKAQKGFNSVSKMMGIYGSLGESVSRRSVTRDFFRLENSGVIEFARYEGTAKQYCLTDDSESSFSSELAWVLVTLEDSIKRICSKEMLQSLESELSLAKKKLNHTIRHLPQSKLCMFDRKVSPIASVLVKSNVLSEVLDPIKEVIWDDSLSLSFQHAGIASLQKVNQPSVKLINERLFLCGKVGSDRRNSLCVSLDKVKFANDIADIPFRESIISIKAA